VRFSSMASKPRSLVCPLCEAGRLYPLGDDQTRCDSCRGSLSGAMLEALSEIVTLQDTLGSHACECGHPEMRLLPDGVFHCPACGCEVLPLATS
jgi:ribosomal protein L37AE/L43A